MTEQGNNGKKGLGPIAWIAIGCGVVTLIVVAVLVIGGLFVAHKVKQAGFDPELWEKNPTLAASKVLSAFNPDLEVVEVDEDAGTITIRDKKTGKIVTITRDDLENGRISIAVDGEEAVTVTTSGDGDEGGTVTIHTDEGTAVIGGGENGPAAPDWLPVYPGAAVENTYGVTSETERSGMVSQSTGDDVDTVVKAMAEALQSAGFTVNTQTMQENGTTTGALITGTDDRNQRNVQVMIGAEDGSTTIAITYDEKLGG